VYTTNTWTGILRETEEMTPQWHSRRNIPYQDMWQADRIWLKEVLNGKKVAAHIYFTTDGIPGKDQEVFDHIEYDEALWEEN
jgi:8-oxo-dGTP diphosphatase